MRNNPFSSSSMVTTTTSSFSSLSQRPLMGTGFSSSFGLATPSSGVSVSGSTSLFGDFVSSAPLNSLAGAAQSLAQLNAPPRSLPHSIAGYSGPTIPEMRQNPALSASAQEVLNYLCQQIPALASYPSHQAPGAPAPSLVPAPLHSCLAASTSSSPSQL